MQEFSIANRAELERRCRDKVSVRPDRSPYHRQLEQGISMFFDQLIRILQAESQGKPGEGVAVSGPPAGEPFGNAELDATAGIHGADLLALGYSINDVVHDYADLCQAVSDLSINLNETFEINEFRTLNRCLDSGVAGAVTALSERRYLSIADEQALKFNERLSFFAHELRNRLVSATLAIAAIKFGNIGSERSTRSILDRSVVDSGRSPRSVLAQEWR